MSPPHDPLDNVRTPQDPLKSIALRHAMLSFALRRGAGADAEDAVQATLADAFQRKDRPTDPDQLRRWMWGILRHKVVDVQRKRSREAELPERDLDGGALEPHDADGLLDWAAARLPTGGDAKQTLDWLLREAEGESLEEIAKDAALPPARVRKRVSRLREHFRLHWHKEVLALAALGITLAWLSWFVRSTTSDPAPIAREPVQPPLDPSRERARVLRDVAHDACERGAWQRCQALLEEALELDAEEDPRANRERRLAGERLAPPAPEVPPTQPRTPAPRSTPPAPRPSPQRSGGSSL